MSSEGRVQLNQRMGAPACGARVAGVACGALERARQRQVRAARVLLAGRPLRHERIGVSRRPRGELDDRDGGAARGGGSFRYWNPGRR